MADKKNGLFLLSEKPAGTQTLADLKSALSQVFLCSQLHCTIGAQFHTCQMQRRKISVSLHCIIAVHYVADLFQGSTWKHI